MMNNYTERKYNYFNQHLIEKDLDAIKDFIERQRGAIENLKRENAELRDNFYKDKELSRMKTELEGLRVEMSKGFPISKTEHEAINNWIKEHEATAHNAKTLEERLARHGAAGRGYRYIFYPTGLGTFGEVVCTDCGEKFLFQNI